MTIYQMSRGLTLEVSQVLVVKVTGATLVVISTGIQTTFVCPVIFSFAECPNY